MSEISDWDILRNLLFATRWTLALSMAAFIGGGIVGLILVFIKTQNNSLLNGFYRLYIEIFQGTPLLIQLFLAFFGLSLLHIDLSAWSAAVIALTLFSSAFLAEIWRGCIESIDKGQWEASRCLGLSYTEQMRFIILPQAFKISIPPTVGFSVQIVKGTALASIIGFVELTKAGTMLNNATFEPFKVFGLVAIIYFLICFPLSLASKRLERNLNVSR